MRCELDPVSSEVIKNHSLAQLFEYMVQSPPLTPFLSPAWLSSWLNQIPSNAQIYKAAFFEVDELVAFAFVVLCRQRRRRIFTKRIVYLNEYPVDGYDFVIEHNDIVRLKEGLDSYVLWSVLLEELRKKEPWDEISIRLTHQENVDALTAAADEAGLYGEVEKRDEDVFADFASFHSWPECESDLFSRSKRSQIRRSEKAFRSKYGDISLEQAGSVDEALLWFEQLGELHTKTWNERAMPGVFADAPWVSFHREIIRSNFQSVQMLKIKAGSWVVGYLYNLVMEGRAYNIQSGFWYEAGNQFKPGLLSHYLAMQLCYEKNFSEYHFLAGGESYKKSLSNKSVALLTVSLKKKTFSMLFERYLVKVVRQIKRLKLV